MYQDIYKKPAKYRLRWRFDYATDKKSYFGGWNSSHSKAWSVNKENLARASIEGKHLLTSQRKILAACDGHEFVNFKWHAFIAHKVDQVGKFIATPIGLVLQTRELDVLYLMSGDYLIKQRTDEDKQYNYAGFGK